MINLWRKLRSGYDPVAFQSYMCDVLDQSIDCLQDAKDSAALVTTGASSQGGCPQMWSDLTCWLPTPYNTTAWMPCSSDESEVPLNNTQHLFEIGIHCNATTKAWNLLWTQMFCFADMSRVEAGGAITNFPMPEESFFTNSNASGFSTAGAAENSDGSLDDSSTESMRSYETLLKFTVAGHAISLTSLVVALILLTFLRRIHCTRIYIHMNLMTSFLLRGLVWILHSAAFKDSNTVDELAEVRSLKLAMIAGRYNVSDLPDLYFFRDKYCSTLGQVNYAWCRVYYVCLNYIVVANYFWVLVEGLYLQLLLRAVVFSAKKYMRGFLVLGWLLPCVFVICGVLAMSFNPNDNISDRCWFENETQVSKWIIKVPILVSLLISFIIFVMVIRVVGSKLKRNQKQHRRSSHVWRGDYRWRLTKSTVSLIPLLGIQYLVTGFLDTDMSDKKALFAIKAFELSFVSIQGFLVALIYCFLNGEVQDECCKVWKRLKTHWELHRKEKYHLKELKRKRSCSATNSTGAITYNTYLASRKASTTYFTSEQNGNSGRQRLPSDKSRTADPSHSSRRLRSSSLGFMRRSSSNRDDALDQSDVFLAQTTSTRLLTSDGPASDNNLGCPASRERHFLQESRINIEENPEEAENNASSSTTGSQQQQQDLEDCEKFSQNAEGGRLLPSNENEPLPRDPAVDVTEVRRSDALVNEDECAPKATVRDCSRVAPLNGCSERNSFKQLVTSCRIDSLDSVCV